MTDRIEPLHRPSAYIWVNDAPTEHLAEHGFRYDLDGWDRRRPGLQVSFTAYGRYQRVTFDPLTGEVEVREMPAEDGS